MSITEGSILCILFRPAGPPIRSVENVHDDKMNRLTMSEAQSRDGTVIESVDDRPSLDWNRLRDANDDYDSILFYPEREIVLKDGEFKLGLPSPK